MYIAKPQAHNSYTLASTATITFWDAPEKTEFENVTITQRMVNVFIIKVNDIKQMTKLKCRFTFYFT